MEGVCNWQVLGISVLKFFEDNRRVGLERRRVFAPRPGGGEGLSIWSSCPQFSHNVGEVEKG
jgi:hypothetical protein